MDWSLGRYEHIAAGLLPAARVVVQRAAPRPGERVLDVGCGTGNGALLAAELGASATGIDPAERLLEVARGEAGTRGLEIAFLRGEAAALPIADAVADAVISIFGVIFAADAPAAVAEMVRVSAPGARIVLAAWLPTGPLNEVMSVRRQAVAAAEETPPGPPPFPWHERDALAGLFGPHGRSVELQEHGLTFVAPSPAAFLDSEMRDGPMWIAARGALERDGGFVEVRDRALEILERANEEPGGFGLTSPYAVAVARAT